MKLTIINREWEENYRCSVYIDRKKVNLKKKSEDSEICFDEAGEIKIKYSNYILESKAFLVWGTLYWVLAFICGIEPHPFGLPVDAELILDINENDDDNITIKTNPIDNKEPFTINGVCGIVKNCFIIKEKSKRRWIILEIVPISILICLLFMVALIALPDKREVIIALMIIAVCCYWRRTYIFLKNKRKLFVNDEVKT